MLAQIYSQLFIRYEALRWLWLWFSQEWSDGLYRHVIGRPILHMEDEDSISMAFLYSPPSAVYQRRNTAYSAVYNNKKSISLGQQFIFGICLTLLFQFIVYIYKQIGSYQTMVSVATKCSKVLKGNMHRLISCEKCQESGFETPNAVKVLNIKMLNVLFKLLIQMVIWVGNNCSTNM